MGEICSLLQTSSCSHCSGCSHSPGLACSIPLAVAVGSGMWPKLDQWDSIQGLFFWKEKLSSYWIGGARSRCWSRENLHEKPNPRRSGREKSNTRTWRWIQQNLDDVILSSGNPADVGTFCSTPTRPSIEPPLHLFLLQLLKICLRPHTCCNLAIVPSAPSLIWMHLLAGS